MLKTVTIPKRHANLLQLIMILKGFNEQIHVQLKEAAKGFKELALLNEDLFVLRIKIKRP